MNRGQLARSAAFRVFASPSRESTPRPCGFRHEPCAKRRWSSYERRNVRKEIHSLPSKEHGASCVLMLASTGGGSWYGKISSLNSPTCGTDATAGKGPSSSVY